MQGAARDGKEYHYRIRHMGHGGVLRSVIGGLGVCPQKPRAGSTTLRSSFRIPQSAQFVLGEPTEGRFPGYSSLPVTVIVNGRKETEQFQLSLDGKRVLRVQEFGLISDPLESITTGSRPVRGNPEATASCLMTYSVLTALRCTPPSPG
jgi:hypothetical protein